MRAPSVHASGARNHPPASHASSRSLAVSLGHCREHGRAQALSPCQEPQAIVPRSFVKSKFTPFVRDTTHPCQAAIGALVTVCNLRETTSSDFAFAAISIDDLGIARRLRRRDTTRLLGAPQPDTRSHERSVAIDRISLASRGAKTGVIHWGLPRNVGLT